MLENPMVIATVLENPIVIATIFFAMNTWPTSGILPKQMCSDSVPCFIYLPNMTYYVGEPLPPKKSATEFELPFKTTSRGALKRKTPTKKVWLYFNFPFKTTTRGALKRKPPPQQNMWRRPRAAVRAMLSPRTLPARRRGLWQAVDCGQGLEVEKSSTPSKSGFCQLLSCSVTLQKKGNPFLGRPF